MTDPRCKPASFIKLPVGEPSGECHLPDEGDIVRIDPVSRRVVDPKPADRTFFDEITDRARYLSREFNSDAEGWLASDPPLTVFIRALSAIEAYGENVEKYVPEYRDALGPKKQQIEDLLRARGNLAAGQKLTSKFCRQELIDVIRNMCGAAAAGDVLTMRLSRVVEMLRVSETGKGLAWPPGTENPPTSTDDSPQKKHRAPRIRNPAAQQMMEATLLLHHRYEHGRAIGNSQPIEQRALRNQGGKRIASVGAVSKFFTKHFGGCEAYKRLCNGEHKLALKLKTLADGRLTASGHSQFTTS